MKSEAGGCPVEGSETCMEAKLARGVASGRAGGQFKPAKKGQEIWLYLKDKEMLWRDVKQSETEINRFEKLSVVDIQTAVQEQGGDGFDGTSEEGFHSNTYRRGHCKNRWMRQCLDLNLAQGKYQTLPNYWGYK